MLVEIDPTDFRLAITQQEAAVARAELRLAQEQAEAEAALRAWRKLEGDRPAAPLVLRAPQINEARASVEAAKAMLQRAQTDLARCRVQLPFAGRVRSVHADIGQTVQRGQRLAVTMDTSELEVRLPVPLRDAGFADLPIGATVDFKHIPFNVKYQYPFRARDVIMLVGGTGIAPMVQVEVVERGRNGVDMLQFLSTTAMSRSKMAPFRRSPIDAVFNETCRFQALHLNALELDAVARCVANLVVEGALHQQHLTLSLPPPAPTSSSPSWTKTPTSVWVP